jgi:hypothetical protein
MQFSRRASITGGLAAAIMAGLTAPETAFTQSVPGSPEDEAAVRKYVENFDHPWNRHDADALFGFPEAATETPKEFDQQIVNSAGSPLFVIPKPPDPELSKAVQSCLDRKSRGSAPNRYRNE